MKRFLCVLIMGMLLVPFAVAEQIDISSMTTDELIELGNRIAAEINARNTNKDDSVIVDNDRCRIEIKRNYVVEYNDNLISVIEFYFTNKSEKNRSFGESFYTWQQYQDGISLKSSYYEGGGEGLYTTVRPGVTILITYSAILRNDQSPIEIEFDFGYGADNRIVNRQLEIR